MIQDMNKGASLPLVKYMNRPLGHRMRYTKGLTISSFLIVRR